MPALLRTRLLWVVLIGASFLVLQLVYLNYFYNIDRTGESSMRHQRAGLGGGINIPTARLPDVPPVGASFPLDKPVFPKVIPVIVLACNRPTVRRTLDNLLAHLRTHYRGPIQFPVYVSAGCDDSEVRKVIESYAGEISTLRPPDQSNLDVPPDQQRFVGYFRIAHHYKSVFEQIFTELKHTLAIVVEDDLDISIDFFDYFAALAPLLLNDSSLYCVSAWNDNGKKELIDASSPKLLYRTDFFPGLGWMLTKRLWEELRDKWPPAYWDEFLRTPEVRKNRSCIRPEISRTITFGSTGVSGGQFFNTHLRFIELNQQHVDFSNSNLSYLLPHIYNPNFHRQVYKDAQPISISSLSSLTPPSAGEMRTYRLNYRTQADFILAAKYLGVMQDFKYGVPRMAYAGVVSVFFRGNRVFLAPPTNWDHYDLSWT